VNLTRKEGMRDYTLLNLFLDSGIRASEAASLHIDYFDVTVQVPQSGYNKLIH